MPDSRGVKRGPSRYRSKYCLILKATIGMKHSLDTSLHLKFDRATSRKLTCNRPSVAPQDSLLERYISHSVCRDRAARSLNTAQMMKTMGGRTLTFGGHGRGGLGHMTTCDRQFPRNYRSFLNSLPYSLHLIRYEVNFSYFLAMIVVDLALTVIGKLGGL